MKYRLKPLEVEAITFDELQKKHKQIIKNMTASHIVIKYRDISLVWHEKGHYRIPTSIKFIGMSKGEVLVQSSDGRLSVHNQDDFLKKHERIDNV